MVMKNSKFSISLYVCISLTRTLFSSGENLGFHVLDMCVVLHKVDTIYDARQNIGAQIIPNVL